MIVNKKTFTVKIDGVDTELMVKRPDIDTANEADLIHGKAFREGMEAGLMLRDKLMVFMREQKLWDDEKERQWLDANNTILKGELALKKGGIKLSEAKQIALDMRVARYTLQILAADRRKHDSHTAEYHADNVKFNYLISQCVCYPDSGEKYYKSYDDYRSRVKDPVAVPASEALMSLLYEVEDNVEAKLPENKFLLKHKFVNESLHLVDKEGNLVDRLGRRVDEQGRLINSEGKLIDAEGNLLTEDGEYDVKEEAFLDDDGNAIVENDAAIVSETEKMEVSVE